MTKPFTPPGTALPSQETKELQAVILTKVRDGMTISAVARELGYSDAYIRKMYAKALKAIIEQPAQEVRKMELERLDFTLNCVMRVLQRTHWLVNSGAVVKDVVVDTEGNPILDENGKPKIIRLEDTAPVLAAVDRVLKIAERRAKLLGLDLPTKVALTDPTGEKEAQPVQFYMPENGRDGDGHSQD